MRDVLSNLETDVVIKMLMFMGFSTLRTELERQVSRSLVRFEPETDATPVGPIMAGQVGIVLWMVRS